jgi:N-carbamoyl-L-amino-acid hydrolase
MRAKRAGVVFNADFCAVNWTNEEGARFRPSLLGSGTFVGSLPLEVALSSQDDEGITLRQALASIGYLGSDKVPLPTCYLELHVEQGTVLETAGVPIGIVTRNWGATKIDLAFEGEQAHTGPTAMYSRRDALLAAAHAICDVRGIADQWPDRLHTSVGRLVVKPNSSNVVAARTYLSVELRSADDSILVAAGALADAAIKAAAERAQVGLRIVARSDRPIRMMPDAIPQLVAIAAAETGHRSLRLDTVSGHDALSLLGICPIGLVFVPSVGGIAHNEREETREADMESGAAVMLQTAFRLCRSSGNPERAIQAASSQVGVS